MLSWLSWSLLYIISEWLIRIGMTPIVMRRRRPSVAMGWLLVIFFQPWIGLVVYVLIGENRLPRRRIQRRMMAVHEVSTDGRMIVPEPHVIQPRIDPEQRMLVGLAERLGEMPIVGGNRCEVLADTQAVIDRLIEDIDAAEQSVHLLFYIYRDDETGRRVTEALIRAARRGVPCRVLVDAVGSRQMFKRLAPKMAAAGVDVRAALPVNFFRRRLARMDLRNHRKLAMIDGRVAYTGSQNIVNPSYGTRHLVWHDMMMRLRGPIVLQLQAVFVEDWFVEAGEEVEGPGVFPEPEVAGEVPIQTLPSGPTYHTENYQRLVVASLYAAKRHVILTSPYLVPDEPVLQALEVAAMRGVRVELILPKRSDHPITGAAGRAYYDELMRSGVRIHQHTRGLLHSKTMTVDDAFALVGSGNFDIRSFYLNFELNLLLYGPEITAELRFLQQRYMGESARLSHEAWQRRPAIARLVDDMAKLLSPLL